MPKSKIIRLIATTRPAFLILTPCCLLPAIAFVIAENHSIQLPDLAWVLIGALSAHISVNMLNEYQDFSSGLDLHTVRTAFSGGSGTLPLSPELAKSVETGALFSLLITILIGLYLLTVHGWSLLPIGLIGVFSAYFYTTKITHYPLLCLTIPGLAFGPLMINGTYFVLSEHFGLAVFSTSLIVFFLVNNLLLLNQFPDQEADKNAGRCHLPILIGRRKSAWVYTGFLLMAYILLSINVWLSLLPVNSLLGLITIFLAIPAVLITLKHFDEPEKLKTALALNVAVTLITPALIALGIVF